MAGIVGGAFWGGIAGFLRATVGAHEVITTIMLNWIAIYGGKWLFELNGPLQGSAPSLPRSAIIFDSSMLWIIWSPYLHAGFLIALVALVVYYVILNRTTLGYEVRAVGFNAEAARYSGIGVRKNYFLALAIAGAFAGLAGTVDLLGVKGAVDQSDFDTNFVAFTAIAVALLGRNKAVGILFAGLLFAALSAGTSSRNLDPEVFEPALATDLATMIQALVIFFVGAELLIVYIWRSRRYLRLGRPAGRGACPAVIDRYANVRTVAAVGIGLGVLAFVLTMPPFTIRTTLVPIVFGLAGLALGLAALSQGERRLGGFAIAFGFLGTLGGLWAQGVDQTTLEAVLTGGLLASTLRFATPLAFAAMGGIFSERSGVVNIGLEGMMLVGAFFAVWGSIWSGSWVVGLLMAMLSGGLLALIHGVFSIHLRADQIVSGFAVNLLALGLTGYLYSSIYPNGTTKGQITRVPSLEGLFGFLDWVPGADLSLLVWLMFLTVLLSYVVLFKTPIGLADPLGRRASARRGHRRHLRVPRALRGRGHLGSAGGARRGVPVDRVHGQVHREHDQRPRIHRAGSGHLREMAAGLGVRGDAALRFRVCARDPAPARGGHLVEPDLDPAVPPDPDRGGRGDRPLDPAGRRWPPVRQAVTGPGRETARQAGRSCLRCSALAAIPAAAAVTEARGDLRLIHAGFAVPLAAALAIAAIRLARRARRRLERTLGRAGGRRTARAGQVLGWLALYLALTASISVAVYAVEFYLLS